MGQHAGVSTGDDANVIIDPVDKAGAKSCLDVSIGVVRNGGGFEVNANVVCSDAVYPVAGYRRTCSTPIFHSTAQSKTTICSA